MGYTALFGGTFNPFHIGHYAMLCELNLCEDIDEIFILPDKIPPHKECDFLAQDKHRIKMCELAAQEFDKATVCLLEFERQGKSYSFDTVRLLKEKYPDKKFCFVCGGDMLVTLDKWYHFEELIKEIVFFAFMREDTDSVLFEEKLAFLVQKGAQIRVMGGKIPCVNSTYIRNNIKLSADLVPERIYKFIESEGIYSDG